MPVSKVLVLKKKGREKRSKVWQFFARKNHAGPKNKIEKAHDSQKDLLSSAQSCGVTI